MKTDFTQALKELDGTSIRVGEKDLTLKDVSCTSLSLPFADEQISGEEKAKRGLLAFRLYVNPDIDLTLEELGLIKKLVGKGYGSIIVAQAWEMLEGKNEMVDGEFTAKGLK